MKTFFKHRCLQKIRRIGNFVLLFFSVVIPAFWYFMKGYITLYGFFGIGDICYELAYINSYKKQSKKKIRVITTKKRFQVFAFYAAIDKVSSISNKMEQRLLYNDIIVKQLSWYSFIKDVAHYRIPSERTTLEKMRIYYGIDVTESITYPEYIKDKILDVTLKGSVLINLNSNYYKSSRVKQVLINIGNIVLSKGLTLYVNTANDEELFLFDKGAMKYYKPLAKVYSDAHAFGAIFSIRSGFLDLLINSNSNIVCLYDKDEKGFFLRSSFSLNEWKGNSTVSEFFIDEVTSEELFSFVGIK